jgi:hypothetical protein
VPVAELDAGQDGLRVMWSVLQDAGADHDAVASDVVGRAFAILSAMGAASARAFDIGLHFALHALDREVLFGQPIRDRGEGSDQAPIPVSDDVFLYARCAVLTSGKAAYDAVLSDPAQFATTWDLDAEALLELPNAVLDELGADPDSRTDLPSYETGSNPLYWSSTTGFQEQTSSHAPLVVDWRGGWGNHPALILDATRLNPIAATVTRDLGRPGGVLDRWRADRGLVQVGVGLSVPLDWWDQSDRSQVSEGALLVTVILDQADLDLPDPDLVTAVTSKVTAQLSEVARRRRWPAIGWAQDQR